MKREALFADGTDDYRNPSEPKSGEMVTFWFRTAEGDVDTVFLCAGELQYKMKKDRSEYGFDYYIVKLTMDAAEFSYYFEAISGKQHIFFDNYGVSEERRREYFFHVAADYAVPDWSKGAVMYQIFVDRFYNGDTSNDVLTNEYYYIRTPSRKMEDWNEYPSDFSVAEFYGGDLEGVRKKLDYIQGLGVEVIYFNPLFVSPSNHKYDTQDYEYIDPHFGKIVEDGGSLLSPGSADNRLAGRYINRVTNRKNLEASNRFFAELVEEIHARGMRVILDGVFNHCGSFHKWMDREGIYAAGGSSEPGAFDSKTSRYRDYFSFLESKNGETYEGWWGNDTLPKLNYEDSQEMYDCILKIAAKWVSPPYNADGWRLDVAADLGRSPKTNHRFWRDFRRAVKKANPDAIILAEHYGSPRDWLALGDQWDTVMNYDAFMEPLTWFLTGVDKHSDTAKPELKGDAVSFERAMRRHMADFQTSQLFCAMNELSNHDHSRFLTRTNGKVGRANMLGRQAASEGISFGIMRAAVVVQMTWPGAPTIYYGDEAGVCGFTDPDNRRTYPWGREDTALINFHRDMIRMHKEHRVFRKGSLVFLHGEVLHNDALYGEIRDRETETLCYGRFDREEQVVVVINSSPEAKDLLLYVWPAGIPREAVVKRIAVTTETGYSLTPETYAVKDGYLTINMKAGSAAVFMHQMRKDKSKKIISDVLAQ